MPRLSHPPTSSIRANALVLVTTVFVLLLCAEVVLRFVYQPENLGTVIRFDPLLGWSLVPNATLIANDTVRDLHYRMDINSIGLRDDEVATPKPKGRKRILILGDSITFGSGLEFGERFSELLERNLPGDVDVVNAGVPGWGNDQELLFYERDLRGLKPDVVLLEFTAYNDVVNNELRGPMIEKGTKPRFRCADGLLTLEPPDRPAPVEVSLASKVKSVLRKSRLLLFVKRRIDMRNYKQHAQENPLQVHAGYEADRQLSHWSVYDTRGGEAIASAWNVTDCILARLAQDCRQDSVRLIVFAFPLKIEMDRGWRDDLILRTGIDAGDLDFTLPYRRMQSMCARLDIEFLHPQGAFQRAASDGALYFQHDSHPNAHANAVAAHVLHDVLIPAVTRR